MSTNNLDTITIKLYSITARDFYFLLAANNEDAVRSILLGCMVKDKNGARYNVNQIKNFKAQMYLYESDVVPTTFSDKGDDLLGCIITFDMHRNLHSFDYQAQNRFLSSFLQEYKDNGCIEVEITTPEQIRLEQIKSRMRKEIASMLQEINELEALIRDRDAE